MIFLEIAAIYALIIKKKSIFAFEIVRFFMITKSSAW